MLAAERGAAANTLAAYRRDLEQARASIGPLDEAGKDDLTKLASVWSDLAPASIARKASALRQFYGFLIEEGVRADDPSTALPKPATRRPLPKILSHRLASSYCPCVYSVSTCWVQLQWTTSYE